MSRKKPVVTVLMSTYNGIRYVEEQVQSILNQQEVTVRLRIRDDGSSDGTNEVLRKLAFSKQNIHFESGDNLGVTGSFFHLLENAPDKSDFYAFADQDDVWDGDKLIRAATAIFRQMDETPEAPVLYYGRLAFVDEKLNHLGYSQVPTTRGFHNALVQNQATGCTIVMNNSAKKQLCTELPSWALMHDWWCYLVISAFGEVVYDENPALRYRKHGNNVTPATPSFPRELYARTRRFFGENDIPEKVTDQAREFLRIFGDKLDPGKKSLLDGFLEARGKGVVGRLGYALNMPVRRNTAIDNLLMRILIVIGRF